MTGSNNTSGNPSTCPDWLNHYHSHIAGNGWLTVQAGLPCVVLLAGPSIALIRGQHHGDLYGAASLVLGAVLLLTLRETTRTIRHVLLNTCEIKLLTEGIEEVMLWTAVVVGVLLFIIMSCIAALLPELIAKHGLNAFFAILLLTAAQLVVALGLRWRVCARIRAL